jgi:hypothetical protein
MRLRLPEFDLAYFLDQICPIVSKPVVVGVSNRTKPPNSFESVVRLIRAA